MKKQDFKLDKQYSKINKLTEMVKNMMDQIKISNYSPDNMDPQKAQDPTTEILYNKKAPPSEGGKYNNNGGMWTVKHEINSPKFHELLIKTEPKGHTALDPKNFCNYINMYLNALTLLQ